MKKFILVLLLISLETQAQKLPIDSISNKVDFRSIIELDSTYKADKIYSIVKEWFSTNPIKFSRANKDKSADQLEMVIGIQRGNSILVDQLFKNDQPLKLQDFERKKLTGKCLLKYTGRSLGCLRMMYLEYDIKVTIRDSKLKIDITNFTYTHYNQTHFTQSPIMNEWVYDENCESKGNIESLLQCGRCKRELGDFYSYISSDIEAIIDDLKQYIKTNKPENEKW